MGLFGFDRFLDGDGPDRPPKTGPGRWLEAFWDNLGGLLGSNVLTCVGLLPLAMGVSLGLVYESLWLALLGGVLGGAIAGPFWAAMDAVALQCFRGGARGWLGRWGGAMARFLAPASIQGAGLGALGAGFLAAGSFFTALLGEGGRPPLAIWLVLGLDLYLLALAAAVLFPSLAFSKKGDGGRLKRSLSMLVHAPGRVLGTAAVLLAWAALLVGLFPVSVPLALAAGFWPPALLSAQILLPALCAAFGVEDSPGAAFEPAPAPERGLTAGQRTEIWWRRRWPLVLGVVLCVSLLAGALGTLLDRKEPDLQVALVHTQPLPDSVRSALEGSLAALVGDRNGDGKALVQVNDYTVAFDGSAKDVDMQTAGSTLLVTDVAAGVSALYLVEDPQGFLERYADKVNAEGAARWNDCPALAGLDAGSYSALEDIATDLPGQDLLGALTVLPSRSAEDDILTVLLSVD